MIRNAKEENFKNKDVTIEYIEDMSLIAFQGPKAASTLQNLVAGNLSNLNFMEASFMAIPNIDETVLVRRLRETAYLNGGLKIVYDNKHTGTKEEFYFEGGIADYVSFLAKSRTNPYPSKPFFFDNKSGKVNVQVAFQYGEEDEEKEKLIDKVKDRAKEGY